MKTYEVELRALLSKEQYDDMIKHFDSISKGVLNDMDTYTFIAEDYNIKVKNFIHKKNAKIILKNGGEYRQQANEYKLPIAIQDIPKAVEFLSVLTKRKSIDSFQKRVDYQVNDIIVSIKYEQYWGHQIEVEMQVENEAGIPTAKEKLQQFLAQFNVTSMTEEQMKELSNRTLNKLGMKTI